MAYATDVKIFWCDPGMTSITPMQSWTAGRGTLTTILDACLVSGYAQKTVDSVVVSKGIATVNISAGHEWYQWQVVLVDGATPAGLNGEKRVLSRTTNSITFDATGIADGTATGTITVKIAPLGWLKPFSATNKSVYQIDSTKYPTASKAYLQVDDSSWNYGAQVAAYESMTDASTGTDKTPTLGQVNPGFCLGRSETSATSPRYWAIVGDGRCFYFLGHAYSSTTATPEYGSQVSFFGDPISVNEADPYKFIVSGTYSGDYVTQTDRSFSAFTNGEPLGYARRVRGANRVTKSVQLTARGTLSGVSASGADASPGFNFPNMGDNAVQLSRLHLKESGTSDNAYLGYFPGAYFVENRIGSKLHTSRFERIYDSNPVAFPGKVIGYFLTAYSASTPGVTAFDIIGPWR